MSKLLETSFLLILAYISVITTLQVIYERVEIVYINPKYVEVSFCKVSRSARRGPHRYEINCKFTTKVTFAQNLSLYTTFYERVAYAYRSSFIRMNGNICAMLKDPYIGTPFVQQGIKCPVTAGEYFLKNITTNVDHFPYTFPYERGYINLQFNLTQSNEPVAQVNLYLTFKNPPKKQLPKPKEQIGLNKTLK